MPSSVATTVGSALASKAINSLMSKKSSGGSSGTVGASSGPPIQPFRAGGLGLAYTEDGMPYVSYANAPGGTNGQDRLSAVNNLIQSYKTQGAGIRSSVPTIQGIYGTNLADMNANIAKVAPGFGELTKARVNSIQNAGAAARSDLRSNLSKRRVLGSSFADDAFSRQQLDVGQKEAEARATSFLEELDMQTKLIQERLTTQVQGFQDTENLLRDAFSAERAADQTQLDEFNAQLSVMTGIIGNAASIAQQNAALEAQYAAEGAQARGGVSSVLGGQIVNGIQTYGADRGWWGGAGSQGITWNGGRA